MRISDWSSDVCSSDLMANLRSRPFDLSENTSGQVAVAPVAGDHPDCGILHLLAEFKSRSHGGGGRQPEENALHPGKSARNVIGDGTRRDRKSDAQGKRVVVRVGPGGPRLIKNK